LQAAPRYVSERKNNHYRDSGIQAIGPRSRGRLEEVNGSVVAVIDFTASGREEFMSVPGGFRGCVLRPSEALFVAVALRQRSRVLGEQVRDSPVLTGRIFRARTLARNVVVLRIGNRKICNMKIGDVEIGCGPLSGHRRAAHATKSVRCWILPAAGPTVKHLRRNLRGTLRGNLGSKSNRRRDWRGFLV